MVIVLQGINSNASWVTAAFLAGCTEALLTPFERIQTLMLDQVKIIVLLKKEADNDIAWEVLGNDDTLNADEKSQDDIA